MLDHEERFLFREEAVEPGAPGRFPLVDEFALASRLSYFLWSSMPDDELLTLAEKGKLHEPDTLRAQVERLLKDPKAAAFTTNFAGPASTLLHVAQRLSEQGHGRIVVLSSVAGERVRRSNFV